MELLLIGLGVVVFYVCFMVMAGIRKVSDITRCLFFGLLLLVPYLVVAYIWGLLEDTGIMDALLVILVAVVYVWASLSVVVWMCWMPYPGVQAWLSKTKPKRFAFTTLGAVIGVIAFVFVGVDRWLSFIPDSWFIPLGWLVSVCFGRSEPNGIGWLLAFGASLGVLVWLVRINRRLKELREEGEQNENLSIVLGAKEWVKHLTLMPLPERQKEVALLKARHKEASQNSHWPRKRIEACICKAVLEEMNESNRSEGNDSREDVASTTTTQATVSVQTESKFPFP